MWVPSKVLDWFQISKDSVDELRAEVASLKVERDLLKSQLTVVNTNFDWLRMKVNTLEMERVGLMEKAYNIKLPAPEILRQSQPDPSFNPKDFSLEDMGEDLARKLGFPVYDDKNSN